MPSPSLTAPINPRLRPVAQDPITTAATRPVARGAIPWFACIMLLVAAAVSGWFARTAWLGTAVGGCGGSGCAEVAASPHAWLLGLPVGLWGGAVYLASAIALAAGWRRVFTVLAGLIGGAAIWFIGLQALAIGSWCAGCLGVHALALGAVVLAPGGRLSIRRAIPPLGLLACGLALGVAMPAFLPTAKPAAETISATVQAGPVVTAKGDRIELFGGQAAFRRGDFPLYGDPAAEKVAVVLWDPACQHCREMQGDLQEAGNQLAGTGSAIIAIPAGTPGPGETWATRLLGAWRGQPDGYASLAAGLAEPGMGMVVNAGGRAADKWFASRQAAVDPDSSGAEDTHRLARSLLETAWGHAPQKSVPLVLSGSEVTVGAPRGAAALAGLARKDAPKAKDAPVVPEEAGEPMSSPPALAPPNGNEAPGTLEWVRSTLASGSGTADTRAMWVDANDNVFVVGRFVDTVNFWGTSLTATSATLASGFVAKFNASGTLQWVRKLGTTGVTELLAVAGLPSGEIFVAGTASLNFSENGVAFNIPSTQGQNAIWFKLDANGQVLAGANYGGNNTDAITALAATRDGEVAVGGYCAAAINLTGTNIVCSGRDGFAFRLSGTGIVSDMVFVRGVATDSVDFVDVDRDNDLIVGINFSSSSGSFGAGEIPLSGNSIVVAKYAKGSTTPIWYCAHSAPGVFRLNKTVGVTPRDEIVIGGAYSGTVNVGGPTALPVPVGTSGFLAKYDKDGNFVWQKQIGDGPFSVGDQVMNIVVAKSGMIGVGGFMRSPTWTIDGITLATSTAQSGYFAMLDPDGQALWARKLVGTAGTYCWHVQAFSNNDFVFGGFSSAADFGNGTAITTGTGNREAYVARYQGFPYPEIGVEEGGNNLADGGPPLGLGSTFVGTTTAPVTLTIRNDGTEDLTGIAPTLIGVHPGDFILDASATAATLAPGATTSLTVQFAPMALGARAASVSIASDDYDESPFTLALSGTGLPPEVTLTVSPSSVAEDGATNLTYTFTRNGPTTAALTVNFATSGTADAGSDYTLTGQSTFASGIGTVTIPIGSASASLTLDPTTDLVLEEDETAILTVAAGSGYTIGTAAEATGTITNDDAEVSLTAGPTSLAEDAAGTLAFTLTRDGPLGGPLTVNLSVSGSAGFSSDYAVSGADSFSATAATVTFAPGASTAVLEVDPTEDPTVESDESVTLTLAPGSGYLAVNPDTATATIVNDDTDVSVSVAPASVLEDGTTILVFSFSRVGVTSTALTVNFDVGGTATQGSDYSVIGADTISPTSGTVSFAPGSTTANVTVDPTADATAELNESVQLTVAAGSGYNPVNPVSASAFINDDDSNVAVTVSPASIKEDGAQNLVFTFTRTGLTTNAVTVNFTVGGTAGFPGRYAVTGAATFSSSSGTVAMAAGATTATVTVNPYANPALDPDLTVIFTVIGGSGYTVGSPVSATGTIENDDTLVFVDVAPSSVAEDGTANLVYTFTRVGVTNVPLTANFSVGGTATRGSDYTVSGAASLGGSSGTVHFPTGVTTVDVTVDPMADTAVEPDETVVITPTAGTGYSPIDPATGTILADDTDVSIFVAETIRPEDGPVPLVFSFERRGPLANALTANFTVGGTATFGTDYTQTGATSFSATSGSVTFPAGSAFTMVQIDPSADQIPEPDETVILTIVAGSDYHPGYTFSYTGTIINDDIPQEIVVEQPAGSGLTSVGTSGFGPVVNGSSKTRVFTIRNLGTVPLTGISVGKSGTGQGDYAITQPAATVNGGASTTFSVTFTPSESGTRSATLNIASNDADENPFVISLTGTGGTSRQLFDDAMAAVGLSGPNAQPGATPFNDGVSNLLKYAFNMNLVGPDRRLLAPGTGTMGLPVMRIVSGTVRFEFLRRKNSGLVYTPQQSSDLSATGWQPASGTTTVTSIDENWERVQIQQAPGASRFFRVVVNLP